MACLPCLLLNPKQRAKQRTWQQRHAAALARSLRQRHPKLAASYAQLARGNPRVHEIMLYKPHTISMGAGTRRSQRSFTRHTLGAGTVVGRHCSQRDHISQLQHIQSRYPEARVTTRTKWEAECPEAAWNPAMHLQGIGRVEAIPARDVKPGMILSWNYSPAEYEAVSLRDVSAQFVELTERNRETGKEYTRRLKKDRLVSAHWPKATRGYEQSMFPYGRNPCHSLRSQLTPGRTKMDSYIRAEYARMSAYEKRMFRLGQKDTRDGYMHRRQIGPYESRGQQAYELGRIADERTGRNPELLIIGNPRKGRTMRHRKHRKRRVTGYAAFIRAQWKAHRAAFKRLPFKTVSKRLALAWKRKH